MRLRVSDTRHLVVRRATFFTNIKVLLKRKSRIIFAACAVWIVGFLFYQIGKTDGGYSEWSNYSDCSASCGKGTRRKFRTCTNPAPNFIGRSCSGIGRSSETIPCFVKNCPVDGGFTSWSEFEDCTVSCGGGVMRRVRRCSDPEPQFGGKDCEGDTEETRTCNEEIPCPIDGGFSDWSDFTACSVTCGVGVQWRNRTCTNPSPKHGGKICKGAIKEKHHCEIVCGSNPTPTQSNALSVDPTIDPKSPVEWITQF